MSEDVDLLGRELGNERYPTHAELLVTIERAARETLACMTKMMVVFGISLTIIFALLEIFID